MHIKHLLAAMATSLFAVAASANLQFSTTDDHLGRFQATTYGQASLTYLGRSTSSVDYLLMPGSGKLLSTSAPGTSFTGDYVAGELLPLVFGSLNGAYYSTLSGTAAGGAGVVVLGRDEETPFGKFDYVLGFSNGGQHDWDDLRVGLNAVAAVPEPEVFALMLAGLGAVAFAVRRRAKED